MRKIYPPIIGAESSKVDDYQIFENPDFAMIYNKAHQIYFNLSHVDECATIILLYPTEDVIHEKWWIASWYNDKFNAWDIHCDKS